MITVHEKKIPSQLENDILDFAEVAFKNSLIKVKGLFLEGAHSKGTTTPTSDIDLLVYTQFSLNKLLGVCPPGLAINKTLAPITNEGGAVSYFYKERKYELDIHPIKTLSSTKKELIYNLYTPNIDYYFKFVKAIPVRADPDLLQFREDILTE